MTFSIISVMVKQSVCSVPASPGFVRPLQPINATKLFSAAGS